MRVPHWAQFGGPFARMYRGEWFFRLRPQYGEGWKWALGHRMGGFYLIELGPLRIGRHFRPARDTLTGSTDERSENG